MKRNTLLLVVLLGLGYGNPADADIHILLMPSPARIYHDDREITIPTRQLLQMKDNITYKELKAKVAEKFGLGIDNVKDHFSIPTVPLPIKDEESWGKVRALLLHKPNESYPLVSRLQDDS